MAAGQQRTYARRALAGLLVLLVALGGLLAGAVYWSDAQTTPKLGLDLEGGTQIILEPRTDAGQTVSAEQLNQARDIIVQRVDAGGVSGAEVTTQGDRNIVVSIPEIPTQEVRDAISKSSQLQFRPVLAVASGVPVPEPSASPSGTAPPSPSVERDPDRREQRVPDEQQRRPRGPDRADPVAERLREPVAEPQPHGIRRHADRRHRPRVDHPRGPGAVRRARLHRPRGARRGRRRPDQAARHL